MKIIAKTIIMGLLIYSAAFGKYEKTYGIKIRNGSSVKEYFMGDAVYSEVTNVYFLSYDETFEHMTQDKATVILSQDINSAYLYHPKHGYTALFMMGGRVNTIQVGSVEQLDKLGNYIKANAKNYGDELRLKTVIAKLRLEIWGRNIL